jgi:hypothetical protein
MTMKMCSLALLLALTATAATAQIKVNPKAEEALKEQHKKAKDIVWAEAEKGYTATFDNEGYRSTAEFEKNGKWIKTETEMYEEVLAESFLTTVYTKYPDAYIPKVIKRETPDGITFEVILDDDGKAYGYTVDKEGKVLGTK